MSGRPHVLVVDDEPAWAAVLARELSLLDIDVDVAYDAAGARDIVLEPTFNGVVLLDLRLPDGDGLELLEPFLQAHPTCRIVMMTAHGTAADELEAIKKGVHLFVSKSEGKARIIGAVQNALRAKAQLDKLAHYQEMVQERHSFAGIVTRSPQMLRVFDMLAHVIDSRVSVLIQGESGTGKELVARALHVESARRNGPFVAVNCGGIPENLLESELFGHERGAFTGAIAAKKGKFEVADGGTLFLDEIGEMPLHLQVKLLRAVQERQVQRVGATESRAIDVRIVSATHRDLAQMVVDKTFREDLYYRLAVFPVHLPALRDRDGDIALLAQHFLKKVLAEEDKSPKRLSPATLAALDKYPFPGNVRELENIINRAVLLSSGEVIEPRDLPIALLESVHETHQGGAEAPPSEALVEPGEHREIARVVGELQAASRPVGLPLEEALGRFFQSLDRLPTAAELEEALIQHALTLSDGKVTAVARQLGLSRATIYRRLR